MKEAIQKAIEGGYKDFQFDDMENATFVVEKISHYEYKIWGYWKDDIKDYTYTDIRTLFLDPLFWQALGKGNKMFYWKHQMHSFIDHIAEKKDPEEFFKELLK